MSRIGKKPIEIPSGVKVAITDGHAKVEGPKGKLSLELNKNVKVQIKDGKVIVESVDPATVGTAAGSGLRLVGGSSGNGLLLTTTVASNSSAPEHSCCLWY